MLFFSPDVHMPTYNDVTLETHATLTMFTWLYVNIPSEGYPAQQGNYCLPGLPYLTQYRQLNLQILVPTDAYQMYTKYTVWPLSGYLLIPHISWRLVLCSYPLVGLLLQKVQLLFSLQIIIYLLSRQHGFVTSQKQSEEYRVNQAKFLISQVCNMQSLSKVLIHPSTSLELAYLFSCIGATQSQPYGIFSIIVRLIPLESINKLLQFHPCDFLQA